MKSHHWHLCLDVVVIVTMLIATVSSKQHQFNSDCSDPHHKDIICAVKIVDCDADGDFIPKVKTKQQVPGEAHDLRIEPFAKAKPKQKGESYQLSVDISWQTPPENATVHLEGFLLEIEHEKGIDRTCFLFNVSETTWTNKAIMSSPRFHFSTDSVFKFDQSYDVSLTSLPEMHNFSRSITKIVKMPMNPSQNSLSDHVAENCTKYSHPYASKWTAGFRQIVLHSLARTIQMEFVAAPKQYCFEQYEVRLVDESGLELLHTDIISVESMKTEIIDNVTVYFGEYNFTGLDYDKTYVPSVIPVEKAADGRCLCPVDGTDPYDNKVICSCVAAEGKPVRLKRVNLEENDINNSTSPTTTKEEGPTFSVFYVIIIVTSVIVLGCLAHCIRHVYRRYSASGKMVRIRFVQERQLESGGANGRNSLMTNGNVKAPLILNPNLNILIIYAHDCAEHETAVLAFAEYLRDVFNFEVHLDKWDQPAIEANMMDYVSASIVNADKVIIINSMGANHRYHSKIANNGYSVEQANPDMLDHLFLTQIDQALQHPFVISARFTYASYTDVMPSLNGCLQYQIPNNLVQLLSALVGRSLKHDSRLAGYNSQLSKMQSAVSKMEQLRQSDEKWFDHSHVRVPTVASPRQIKPNLVTDDLPVVSPKDRAIPSPSPLPCKVDQDSGVFDRNAINASTSTADIADMNDVSSECTQEDEQTEEVNESEPLVEKADVLTELPQPEDLNVSPDRRHQHQQHIYSKLDDFEADTSGDSGLVSDADLRLISAS